MRNVDAGGGGGALAVVIVECRHRHQGGHMANERWAHPDLPTAAARRRRRRRPHCALQLRITTPRFHHGRYAPFIGWFTGSFKTPFQVAFESAEPTFHGANFSEAALRWQGLSNILVLPGQWL